ncbi:MAG: hypothetical protein ABIO39_12375 [Caulobacteraceae bacterium]
MNGLAAAASLGGGAALGAERSRRAPMTAKGLDEMVRTVGAPGGLVCVRATPATEGPFYYETSLQRKSIAEKRPGVPVRLGITLGGLSMDPRNPGNETGRCFPLAGVVVDIWHADAAGLYSNVGTDLQPADTLGQTFMRGHQVTDQNGYVEFDTIVPGWEIVAAAPGVPGAPPVVPFLRTTHIHVKAFHGREVITTQLFFDDSLLDQIFAEVEPYKSHRVITVPRLDRPVPRIRNTEDFVFKAMKAQPMAVERVDGVLVAKAMIGVMSLGDGGFRTLFR